MVSQGSWVRVPFKPDSFIFSSTTFHNCLLFACITKIVFLTQINLSDIHFYVLSITLVWRRSKGNLGKAMEKPCIYSPFLFFPPSGKFTTLVKYKLSVNQPINQQFYSHLKPQLSIFTIYK